MKPSLAPNRVRPALILFLMLMLGPLAGSLLITRAENNNNNVANTAPTGTTNAQPQNSAAGAKPSTAASSSASASASPATPQPSTPAAGTTPASTPATSASPASSPLSLMVVGAYRDDPTDTKHERDSGLYDRIIVEVENLAQWISANDASKLILYVDGKPLKGIHPDVLQVSPEEEKKFAEEGKKNVGKLRFQLMRTDESREQWDALLGRPDGFVRDVEITLGVPDSSSNAVILQPSKARMPFTLINKVGLGVFLAVAALALIVFLKWGLNSLRDPSSSRPVEERPFSLGRCQMAWWFLWVAASYVFIWMVTSDYGSLTGSVLTLIGISAGTALGASVVNSNKRDDAEKKLEHLTGDSILSPPTMAAAQAVPAVAKLMQQANPQTRGSLYNDIFRDPDGTLSFPRIQIVIWTIVLTVIFLAQVYNRLAMPDFPGTLLALMGISSGTYIGLKLPDRES
jgi:hypothetical protein